MNTKVREYVEKPKVVRAVQWDCFNYDEANSFCKDRMLIEQRGNETLAVVKQLDGGEFVLHYGDYVVEKGDGEFVCMKREEFEKNYEEVKYGY